MLTPLRGALLLAAIAACAWFAIGIRQTHDTARADAILASGPPLTVAQQRQVSSLLHAASFLNPDAQVNVLQAQLAAERGHLSHADEIVLGVLRDEPMNAPAWFWLAQNAASPRLLLLALQHLARLVPRP